MITQIQICQKSNSHKQIKNTRKCRFCLKDEKLKQLLPVCMTVIQNDEVTNVKKRNPFTSLKETLIDTAVNDC